MCIYVYVYVCVWHHARRPRLTSAQSSLPCQLQPQSLGQAPDQSHVMSLEALSISLVLSTGTILVSLVLSIGVLQKQAASLVMATEAVPKPLASLVASMEAVPEFSPRRAPVPEFSPEWAPVPESSPGRASRPEMFLFLSSLFHH